MNRTTV